MWLSNCAGRLRRGLEPVSRWSVIVGGLALLVMVFLITASVALRATIKFPIQGDIELVEVLLIIVAFAGMASTELAKQHIRVDVLVDRFSPTAKLAISTSANLVTLVIIAIISWQSVTQAQRLLLQHFETGILEIPLWPFALVTALFMGLFALVVLADFLESLSKLVASEGSHKYLGLIPGIVVILALFATAFWPGILPGQIEPTTFGLVALLLLFALIFLRVHIGAAMAMAALWGMSYLASRGAGLAAIGMVSQTVASDYNWSVVPLFTLVGLLVAAAAFSKDLYDTAYKWLGRLRGGLASATIAASAGFAAVVGSSVIGVVTLGTIALPEMRAYKYDDKLATGSICAGSTLGILIPPSMGFIVYGIVTEQSIGRLFIAGILPGILLASLLILSIYVRCRINPTLGPPGPATKLREKVVSLKNSWPVALLFLMVIGGIYAGIFTPTEAAGIGAFCSLAIGLAMRRISFKGFKDAVTGTMRMTAMLFFILIFSSAMIQFFAITRIPFLLGSFAAGLAVPPYVTLALILFIFLILGCLLPAIPVIILTMPIIFPVVTALGFDPVWFGVLMVIMVEIGVLTPPIGVNVFAMAGISDVPMYSIFRGVVPFWLVMLLAIAILAAFPQIALFLPGLMAGAP